MIKKAGHKRDYLNLILLWAFLFFLFVSPPPSAGSLLNHPFPTISAKELHKRLQPYVNQVKSLLKGRISDNHYQKILAYLTKIPNPAKFSGENIELGKVLPVLFPKFFRKHALTGKFDFYITIQKSMDGKRIFHARFSFKNLKFLKSNQTTFTANQIIAICNLTLLPRHRRIKGSVTCFLDAPTTESRRKPILTTKAAKATIHCTFSNQTYVLAARFDRATCPSIQWGKRIVRNAIAEMISFTPEQIKVRNLSLLYDSQLQKLTMFRLNLTSSTFESSGSLIVKTPLPRTYLPSIKEFQGKICFNAQGAITSRPLLSLSLSCKEARLCFKEAPDLPINELYMEIKSDKNSLSISSLRLSLDDITCEISAATKDITQFPNDFSGTLNLVVPDLKTVCTVLQKIIQPFPYPMACSGPFSLRMEGEGAPSQLHFRGKILFQGTVEAPSRSVSLRHIELSLPFYLLLPFNKHDQSSLSVSHISPPQPETGTLSIQAIDFVFVPFRNVSCLLLAFKDRLSANKLAFDLFRGRSQGEGSFVLLPPYPWHIALHLTGISLHDICDHIPGFRDALSGKVNSTLTLEGIGGKLSKIRGLFEAKAIKTKEEPLRISQEFIKQLTGKKGKMFFFQRYRPYNKGIIRARIERGIITFETLELSHKTLGFKDLSITVSKLSNRISIKDLIWEILQIPKSNVAHPIIKTN